MPALTGHFGDVILVLTTMVAAVVARSDDLTSAAFVCALHSFSSRTLMLREYPKWEEI